MPDKISPRSFVSFGRGQTGLPTIQPTLPSSPSRRKSERRGASAAVTRRCEGGGINP